MNTVVRQHLASSPYASQRRPQPSAEAKQLLSLGRNRNWRFRVLGKAPMPENPVRLGDWLLVPAQSDSTAIPVRSLARVHAIFLAGIRPQGFVLVHEAPKLLKAPQGTGPRGQGTTAETRLESSTIKWISAVGGALVLAVAAVAGLVMVAAALIALASVLIVPAVLMAAALGVDPILVAVTDDDEWIEIDRWQTE